MSNYLQTGATQAQLDDYIRDSHGPHEDVTLLDCGHWGLETEGHAIDRDTLVCLGCYAIRTIPRSG